MLDFLRLQILNRLWARCRVTMFAIQPCLRLPLRLSGPRGPSPMLRTSLHAREVRLDDVV